MSASDEALAERCYDEDMRVERIVHLATMAAGQSLDMDVAEWLMDYGVLPGLAQGALRDLADPDDTGRRDDVEEAVQQALVDRSLYGWCVEAAHPVWTRVGEKSLRSSWGNYATATFYGETYSEALEQAFAWTAQDLAAALASETTP